MGKVIGGSVLTEKRAQRQEKDSRKRAAKELNVFREVNAYVNSHRQEAVATGMTSSKTMQHGVDLCVAIAKARRLNAMHRVSVRRLEWAIVEHIPTEEEGNITEVSMGRWAVLLVRHPDGVYVMGPDAEVPLLSNYPHRVVEMTVDSMIGRWETIADGEPDASEQ